jgi:hypothetical protein
MNLLSLKGFSQPSNVQCVHFVHRRLRLTVAETEVLVQTDDLTPYVIERVPNPFLRGTL